MKYYFYIPIPINKDGNGPCDEKDSVKIIHEIWDDGFLTVAVCPSREQAEELVLLLNYTLRPVSTQADASTGLRQVFLIWGVVLASCWFLVMAAIAAADFFKVIEVCYGC